MLIRYGAVVLSPDAGGAAAFLDALRPLIGRAQNNRQRMVGRVEIEEKPEALGERLGGR